MRFARDLKGNKKSFYHSSKNKRLKKENVGFFLNGANFLVTMETDKVPGATFASDLPTGPPSSICLRFKEENYPQ